MPSPVVAKPCHIVSTILKTKQEMHVYKNPVDCSRRINILGELYQLVAASKRVSADRLNMQFNDIELGVFCETNDDCIC